MKRIIISAAVALAVLAGCKKDKDEAVNITTITATMPADADSELKLSLAGENKNEVRWTTGDRIYVAEVSGNALDNAFGLSAFEAKTVAADGKTATFEMVAGQKTLTAGRTYVACHVGNFDATRTKVEDGILIHIPYFAVGLVQMNAGAYPEADGDLFFASAPVAASASGAAFAFKHVTSLIEFDIWTDDATITGFQINKVSIAASAGRLFAGRLSVNAAGTVAALRAEDYSEVSLRNGNASTLYTLNETHRKVRLPMMWDPAATASGTFNITLHPATGTGTPFVFTKTAKKLEPGVIYQMQMQVTAGDLPENSQAQVRKTAHI